MAVDSNHEDVDRISKKSRPAAPPRRRKTTKRKKKATVARSAGPAEEAPASAAEVRQLDVSEVAEALPAGESGPADTVKTGPVKRTKRRPKKKIAREAKSGKPAERAPQPAAQTTKPPAAQGAAPPGAAEAQGVEQQTERGQSTVEAVRSERPRRRSTSRRGRRTKEEVQPSVEVPAPPEEKPTSGPRQKKRPTVPARPPAVAASEARGARKMVINVSGGEECRIAVIHEGRLEELFIERASTQSHVGNIYKGKVTNVEPSIQAAFVDFGLPKNGFLHISDVQPQYFPDHKREAENVGRKIPRHNRPPIQKCFRRGQEVIVQITKEGVGTKGPTLTTYLSIPGRFLVMMPGMSRHGVSRKIEDEEARRKMRTVLNELTLPPDMGFILRTAGLDRPKRDLQRDLNYLLRLWHKVVDCVKESNAPAELYRESDLVTRTIRDVYTTEFGGVIVDDADTAARVGEFLQIAMPRSKSAVELHTDREPLFHRFGIEDEIERINSRHVPLPSGGSLVIDSTEALVAIDVNSGRFRSLDDAEETAFQIDLEAAEEIARQLRLRDLGGLIVCDFIDLRMDRHCRAVEKALRDGLKKHKERARILRMSAFGIIEMTRQRQGPSVKRNIYFDCSHCGGSGLVKMPESMILDVMRFVQLAVHQERVQRVTVSVANEVAFKLLNSKRGALSQIEAESGKSVNIRGDASFTSDQVEYQCEDSRGQPVNVPHPSALERSGTSGASRNRRG